MTQRDKLLEKIRNQPKGVRFEEIDNLLKGFGFERRDPRSGSSHYVYKLGIHKKTVAKHKPFIHFKTVKEILKNIDEILGN